MIAVSRAIGDWEYKNPGLLPEMEKKRKSVKKKKSSEPKEDYSKLPYPGAGRIYRNIEESKKH